MTSKEKLRERVEALTEEQADVALRLVEQGLDDPMLRAFAAAPVDDESWTEDDAAAIAEVEADRASGVPTISHEEIKREFDIE
jgi:hypothetical protein